MKRPIAPTLASKLSDKVQKNRTTKKQKTKGEREDDANDQNKILEEKTVGQKVTPSTVLKSSFFNQECITLSKQLLGKVLVRNVGGTRLAARIVETESYVGTIDAACHTFNGRRTPRNEAMWMSPGTAYVYMTYGMYFCFNISSKGDGCAVLIRALEPLEGLDSMRNSRTLKASKAKQIKDKDLCNGPAKACMAMQLSKDSHDQHNMCDSTSFWVEDGENIKEEEIVSCPRIGIDSTPEEWRDKPLRFYIKGNKFVSKINKDAEGKMEEGLGKSEQN